MSAVKRIAHAVVIRCDYIDTKRMADLCEEIDAVKTYTDEDRAYLYRLMSRLRTGLNPS